MMNIRRLYLVLVLTAAMVHASPLLAQTSDSTAKPKSDVSIEADEMEVIDAENKTIFRGNVSAIRDADTIKSDQLVVNSVDVKQPDGTMKSQVNLLKATGHVVIVSGTQTITSEWANIYDKENRLEAGGNVTVDQDRTVIKGELFTVDLKTKHSVMKGGNKRVTGNFVPK